MFKKVLAVMLASCMIFGAVGVMADDSAAESVDSTAEAEGGVIEFNWEDVTSQEGAEDMIAAGEFKTFDEIACQMWVPNVMAPVELTDEDIENGYIGYFSTAEEDGIASVMYVDAGGMDIETYKAELAADEEVTGLTDVVINGIQGIGYDLEDKDTTCVSFPTESGYILEFSFAPASDENFAAVVMCMIASIQPEEVAEDSAAESAESAA